LLLCVFPATAGAVPFAERITESRYEALVVGGPDAAAGVGDWAFGNGTLCAAVSDAEHESPLSDRGGVLIDLGHCGRGDDQWSALQPLLNLDRSVSLPIETIEAGADAEAAWVRVAAARGGIDVVTTYRLDRRAPDELLVTTEVTRADDDADRFFAWADVILHASGQLRPFAVYRPERGLSRGFRLPDGDTDSLTALIDAMIPADAVILVGDPRAAPPLSYAVVWRKRVLRQADGSQAQPPALANVGESHSMLGSFSGPVWFGGDGPTGLGELAQMPLLNLAPGDTLVLERAILVAAESSPAPLTDRLFPDDPWLTGRVDDGEALIHVETGEGVPLTAVRPGLGGAFTVRAPTGSLRLRVVSSAGAEVIRTVEMPAGGLDVGLLASGTRGWLGLPRGETMRLVIEPLDGQPLRLGADGFGFRVGERRILAGSEADAVSLAGLAGDPERIALLPGDYRVTATRGPEYTVDAGLVTITGGEESALLLAAPTRAVATPGWIGADLHVHSAYSFDSAFPLPRQLAALAANGVEVVVSTEHDRAIDPRPAVAALGLGDRLRAFPGVEATASFLGGDVATSAGHLNAFPITPRPKAYRGGAPHAEGRRLGATFADLREDPAKPILQMNHPRATTPDAFDNQEYFTHLGTGVGPYDPTKPLDEEPNAVLLEVAPGGQRDLDFDAIELLNGPSRERYRLTRADWFSLLLQGEVKTATANSDSHTAGHLPGLPRTYVAVAGDLETLDADAFFQALREGRAYGTSGPLLNVTLGRAGLGETYDGPEATLRIAVTAAPWVPIDRARVYVNGGLVETLTIRPDEEVLVPLRFDRDAFVTVEVEGPADARFDTLLQGHAPFAFTNPIFVDADEDGAWTAPGLPDALPATLTRPLETP